MQGSPLAVVVLSCGPLGAEVADSLFGMPGVAAVALVTAPYPVPKTFPAKVRHIWRHQGPMGFPRVLAARFAGQRPAAEPVEPRTGVTHLSVGDFHGSATIEAISRLAPDLGVVAGTPILKESVFGIPRLGCINLHSGKAPEYRGSAPGFWELYNGEAEVGITIHRVTATLDGGNILLQETFPLERQPDGDPMLYLDHYRRDVLRPNGVRMLTDAVAAIVACKTDERAQDRAAARTYRAPDRHAVRELKRRVATRRRGDSA